MSKAVLISIQPKWCKMIVDGEKTIEVRKTMPKLKTPFKCYIYCTYGEGLIERSDICIPNNLIGCNVTKEKTWGNCCNGKVIGEFVCDFIVQYKAELWDDETFERIQERYEPEDFAEYGEYEYTTIADNGDDFWKDNMFCKASGVSIEELRKYVGTGIHEFYGWHISDLVIYDKPKELSEYTGLRETKFGFAPVCMTRAPQSWRYVEEG